MGYAENFALWCEKAKDAETARELADMKENEELKKERFSEDLKFGTAGLRGIIGAGIACMNLYTVRRTTQGLANYINERYGGGAVAVACDSRNMSESFARETAAVLAANGVDVYIYPELAPTPMLSFAVRDLKAKAGVMITASHNPAAYNGYKAYGPDGCQMTLEDSAAVYSRIEKVDLFSGAALCDFDSAVKDGRIKYIDKLLKERYYAAVLSQRINTDACRRYPLKIVYTPLNGAGNLPCRRLFEEIGVNSVTVVPQQELPDGNFTTCPYPNPETREALSLGLSLANEQKSDIMLGTDPDSDRLGVAVRHEGEYRVLTGNETGLLLLNYILSQRAENKTLPENPVAVRSIVSTSLADSVAKKYGCEMRVVLTGFKYIGEQILLLEQKNEEKRFVFGFEESCGYLAGSYVRDKDAVFAAMLVCEMAAYYRSKNRTLIDVLNEIYAEHGMCMHEVLNFAFSGAGASDEMSAVMSALRERCPKSIAGLEVSGAADYLAGTKTDQNGASEITLPKADIVELDLGESAKLIVRPSGTEPKMKVYLTAKAKTRPECEGILSSLRETVPSLLGIKK